MEELIRRIELILIETGQSDMRFKLGEVIKHAPYEVRDILMKHTDELKELTKAHPLRQDDMNIKKKNALFGKYPSCDMLNNALRFLRDGNTDCAIEEIIFAIEKANGYFHVDNIEMVNIAKQKWAESHS